MNFLLDVKPIENIGGILIYGAQVLLLAVAAVTAILLFFWITRSLYRALFKGGSAGAKAKESVIEPTASHPAGFSADAEIVAVIAAAIAMAESESGGNTKFRVVSFRRK
jgi:hypothetical protein